MALQNSSLDLSTKPSSTSCGSRSFLAMRKKRSPRSDVTKSKKRAESAGLVYSKTSGTPSSLPSEIPTSSILITPAQQYEARLKRMKKSVITSARLHEEELNTGSFRYKPMMITLTYGAPHSWQPNHIADFIRHVRQYLKRRGHIFRYVWVAELQEQRMKKYQCSPEEAVHYHIVIWMPKGLTLPKPDKRGWWSYGFTRVEWARNAVGYLAKYASKGSTDVTLPSGCRICGSGGLSSLSRNERTWWLSPTWVRDYWKPSDRPRRKAGGGFVSLVTGEWLKSPYTCLIEQFGIRIFRLEPPSISSWRGPLPTY